MYILCHGFEEAGGDCERAAIDRFYIQRKPRFRSEKSAADARACLKHHSRHLHAPLCGIFGPNSLNAAHCAAFIWPKSPTKRNAHLAESMFQTRSKLEKTSLSAGGFLRFSAGYRSGQWLRFSRLFTINHGLMYFMFCVWIVTEKKGYKFSGRIIDLRGCWRYNKTVSGSVSFFRNGAADE